MELPFISRAHHEAVTWELRQRLDERIAQVAALEKKLHRLEDLIFKKNFGVELNDTLPKDEVEIEAEPELTVSQKMEAEYEEEQSEERRRLESLKRTRPSQLGAELEKTFARKLSRSAHAARPSQMIFARAAKEALKP